MISIQFMGVCSAQASEENWLAVNLNLPTLMNKVSGFTTDAGSFRMGSMTTTHANLQMAGGYFANADLQTATAKCRALAPTLSVTRNRSTKVSSVGGFVYPFAESEMSRLDVVFENKPTLWKSEVNLSLNAKNFLSPDSVKDFETRVNGILESQLETIKRTGEIDFRMDHFDDVACALITGAANLEINFGVSFELAKHIHEKMIAASDFARIYESLKRKSYKVTGATNRALLGGAFLAEAVRDQFGKSTDEYGVKNFLKLAGALFTPGVDLLQNLTPQDYERVSISLDNLRIYPTPAGLKVNLTPVLVQE